MRISSKGRYGLRVLLDVALYQGGGAVSLRDIARRQSISQKYLWQIVNPLKAAGILQATRGTQGGYVLARDGKTVSLRDVVRILEGEDALVDAASPAENGEHGVATIAREAWLEVEGKLHAVLESISLSDLIQRYKDREQYSSPSYVI